MKYDLKKTMELLDLTFDDVSKYLGIEAPYCRKYAKLGELPSKHVYVLWKRLPGTPIPEDFFYYTSYTLQINMKYHDLKQIDIRDMFHFKNQSTVSKYMSENIPMYEMKELFIENFDPLIVPLEIKYNENNINFYPITDLVSKCNVMESFRKMAIERGKKVKATKDRKKAEASKNSIKENEDKEIN